MGWRMAEGLAATGSTAVKASLESARREDNALQSTGVDRVIGAHERGEGSP
jgi:hypothetical protein